MIRLVQTFGAHAGRSFTFDQERIRLGRMPDSDVAFDPHADLDASGRHAEIRVEGGAHVVVDVGSRNGTFVNGRRVERHVLQPGDEVEFGPGGPRLRVEQLGAAHGVAPARADASTLGATPAAPGAPGGAWATEPEMPGHAPQHETGPLMPDGSVAASPPVMSPPGPMPPTMPPPPGTPARVVPPTAPPLESGEKKYGERTVGLMIQNAVQQQQQQPAPKSSLPIKLAIGCGALGLLLAGAAAVIFVVRDDAAPAPDGAQISAANVGALFRIRAGEDDTPICNAFAVRRDLLATTARCVVELEARRMAGPTLQATGIASTFPVQRMWRHPGFEPGQIGADVGLLEIDGQAPMVVTLAPVERLARLGRGDALLGLGFRDATPRPVAIEVSSVGPIERAGQQLAHDASLADGSPLFDADGAVVGTHATRTQAVGPGYAVRGDLLQGLVAGLQR